MFQNSKILIIQYNTIGFEVEDEACFSADGWEIGYERLELNVKKLGSGAFSVVFKGQLKGEAPVYNMQQKIRYSA